MSQYLSTLSFDLINLLEKADDHNVLIEVGQGKTFRAHSSILRARSEYFHTALSNDWLRKEGDMIIFKKPNISYNAFNIILRYIYSGTIYLEQLEDLEIFKLIEASDELYDLGIEEIDIWGFLIKWGIENSDVPAESEEPKYTEIQVARITPKNLDSEIISSKHAILISSYIEGKNNNSTSSSLPLTIPHSSSHLIKDDGVNIPYRFKLIYRGSRDGFSFESFHKNVDNHGPTAVFIKIADSYEIIGGYNPIGWYSYGNYIATGDSFIFSMTDLDDEDISLLQFDSEQQQSFGTMLKISKVRPYFIDGAIFDTQFHGPCFGYGDIWFGHKSRPRYGSCTKVYYEQNIRDNEEEFYVEEIEVFQIIENNFL
ncbi:unnamed protein product [Rhizophagus irregularis]|nr:unnamed protein product [Rhizophagus irregularis]